MYLRQITINHLRNLVSVNNLELSSKFNLFHGANGSGKTSFLEAIHFLGLGRSFRTHLNSRVIHHEAPHFSLFAELILREDHNLGIGMERHRNGECKIRLANENLRSIVEITQIMPMQLLNPDSRLLLSSGPKLRRQFLDWGVFHVEHLFYSCWLNVQRSLKQRNAALRMMPAQKDMVQLWDVDLAQAAERLDKMRSVYVALLNPEFKNLLTHFGLHNSIELLYKRGWDQDESLQSVLNRSLARDFQLGYTQYGPHRADLIPMIGKIPAFDILSQGQQKLLVYALHLSQGILLQRQTGKSCIYLFDDLAAELDVEKRYKLISVLCNLDAQVFITGISKDSFSELNGRSDKAMFHVEHGSFVSEL
jgi:DNA replication and repair protein RecF